MVIGNGFFSENREAALAEMTERSGCEVKHLPYPTVGNITYYISYVGDLYGQQIIPTLRASASSGRLQAAGVDVECIRAEPVEPRRGPGV